MRISSVIALSTAVVVPFVSAQVVHDSVALIPAPAPTSSLAPTIAPGPFNVSTAASVGSHTPVPLSNLTPSSSATSGAHEPTATPAQPTEAAAGAIPHEMKTSMIGLVGFCIMALVML